MADRNLSFRIQARDDASKVFAKMSQAARTDLSKIQGELDDTATAGQRMARTMSGVADDLERELEQTERAADKLASALGPEFMAKADPGDVERLVNEYRKAGLTFDDIEGEAEELAASIKRLDDVAERAAGTTRKAFDGVDSAARSSAGSIDQNRSVMANFTGNAVQELPGVATAFGPLSMAAGQFAEYAAEGNINMRKLVGQAALLAVVAVAIAGIAKQRQAEAAATAKSKALIEAYAESFRDGATAAAALRSQVEQTGKLEIGVGDDIANFLPAIDRAGLSIEQFSEISEGGTESIDAWGGAQLAAGADADTTAAAVIALTANHEALTRGQEMAEATTRFLGESAEDTAASIEAQAAASEAATAALLAQTEASRAAWGVDLSLRDATDAVEDAQRTYTEAVNEHGPASEEASDAARGLEGAVMALGEAAQTSGENQATAAGRAATAQAEGTAAQIWSLQTVANSLAPGSPLRVNIEGHIAALGRIPRFINTYLNVTPSGEVNIFNPFKNPPGLARGGPTQAGGLYEVTEQGSELLTEGGRTYLMAGANGRVTPAGSNGGGSSSGPTVIVLQVGTVELGRVVVDALKGYERTNGPVPVRVRGG